MTRGNVPDGADQIAEHVSTIGFDSIPVSARTAARRSILDTLGVCIAGFGTTPRLAEILDVLDDSSSGESSLLGNGRNVSAPIAAFVNGAATHVLDYDDVYETMEGHPSAPIVTAALAMAERIGDVDGKRFMTAVAVAQDVYCRLASMRIIRYGLHPPLALGALAASVACSMLLGLNSRKTCNALGIASCTAGGVWQLTLNEDSDLRGYYNAFPARDGLVAALLAERGVGGIANLFEGPAGLFHSLGRDDVDKELVLGGLGTKFTGSGISYKPWPTGRFSHVLIDAVLQIRESHGLRPDDVRKVVVTVGDHAARLFEPPDLRYRPPTPMDAKFSIPYSLAVALVRGNVTIEDFTLERLGDSSVLEMAARVICRRDPSLNTGTTQVHGQVEVELQSGESIGIRQETAYGSPDRPLSWEKLCEKFADCGAHGRPALTPNEAAAMIRHIEYLEDVSDVGVLTRR